VIVGNHQQIREEEFRRPWVGKRLVHPLSLELCVYVGGRY